MPPRQEQERDVIFGPVEVEEETSLTPERHNYRCRSCGTLTWRLHTPVLIQVNEHRGLSIIRNPLPTNCCHQPNYCLVGSG